MEETKRDEVTKVPFQFVKVEVEFQREGESLVKIEKTTDEQKIQQIQEPQEFRDSGSLSDNSEDTPKTGSKRTLQINGKVYENGKINRIKCTQCDHTFKNRANLKQHLKFVHSTEDDAVECNQCYRTFKSVGHLRSHVSSVHAEDKVVKCNTCGRDFLNKKRLNNHIFYSHPEPNESVSCDICKKVFKRKYNLKVHMRQVHPSEEHSVQCPNCDKTFKCNMLLQRHIKWSHPNDGMMYRCQICNRLLPSIACYKKHIRNVHSETENMCTLCSRMFKSRRTLQRHVKTIHDGEKPKKQEYKPGTHQCSECDRKFATTTALFWHFDRHHSNDKQGNYCEICAKDFSDSGNLKRHQETVHSMETAKCHLCSKTFKSPLNLKRHIKVTHAPPEAAQRCDICKKEFKCAMHVRIHVRNVHHKGGTFKCDECDKVFSSNKYLWRHKKTHTSLKEFYCRICSKAFKAPEDVRKHTKRVHMKENEGTSTYNCTKCNSSFGSENEYESHAASCNVLPEGVIKIEIENY